MPNKGTKARNMIVSISGIQGRHPISVGVAYWYRGHFLYGPHGNPVEPIPFATKEIHIIGTTIDTAPPYNPHSMDLEDEREIAALHRGMIREWENMLEENSIKPHTEAFAEQTTLVEGLAFKSTEGENQDTQLAISTPRGRPFALDYYLPAHDAYYNDHALYLAASAPVSNRGTPSRSNTPYHSRPFSPHHEYSSGCAMAPDIRPTASMSRVDQLMDDHGVNCSIQMLQHIAPSLLNEDADAAFTSGPCRDNVRPGFLRTSTMFDDDNDNLTMFRPQVARTTPRGSSVGLDFTPVGYETSWQPVSRTHSCVPSDTTGLDESVGNASDPKSRVRSLASGCSEYSASRNHSRVPGVAPGTNETVGINTSPSTPRISNFASSINERPTPCTHSQVPYISAGANEALCYVSCPTPRVPSLTAAGADAARTFRILTDTTDGFSVPSRKGQLTQSHFGNECVGFGSPSRPNARVSSISSTLQDESNNRDGSGSTVCQMLRHSSLPINTAETFTNITQGSTGPACAASLTQSQAGNRLGTLRSTSRPAPPMQVQLGATRNTSAPSSRPMSRVSSTNNIDDIFGGSSRPLSRAQSKNSMSVLGDDFNGHHSKFFPAGVLALKDSPRNMPRLGAIGTVPPQIRRPRKDSMAKASVALNRVYIAAGCGTSTACNMNTVERSTPALDPNIAASDPSPLDLNMHGRDDPALDPKISGCENLITISSPFSDLEIVKEGPFRCPLHSSDCDGITVTNLHMTENARRTKGLVGPLPLVEAHGRQMVDWSTVLNEERAKSRGM